MRGSYRGIWNALRLVNGATDADITVQIELSDGHARERAYKRSKCCSVATAFELSDGHVRGAANRG